MDIAESSILEIWDLFSEHLLPGKRNDLAVKFLRIFQEQEIDLEDLSDIRGEDEHLDHAFDELSEDADDYDDDMVDDE